MTVELEGAVPPRLLNGKPILAVVEAPPRPKMVVEHARALMMMPKVERLTTGVPTLNAALRGGLPTPRLVIIGGGPGSCKTSFGLHLAHINAKNGVACSVLAADEGRDGIIMRLAQREGLIAAQLQDGEGNDDIRRATWELAIPLIGNLPMFVEEGDEDYVTVEYMAEWLSVISQGKPGILLVDSIQTMRTVEAKEDDTIRSRIDAGVRALKKIAKKHLVIAISEVSRGWYRNKREQIDPMAAFKESGGIEYAAATAMVLSTVADDDNAFDVVVPKNRGYERKPFRLRLDRARMTFREAEMPDGNEDLEPRRGRPGPKTVPADTLLGIVERISITRPGLSSLELRDAVMLDAKCGRPAASDAIAEAKRQGVIVTERSGKRETVRHA